MQDEEDDAAEVWTSPQRTLFELIDLGFRDFFQHNRFGRGCPRATSFRRDASM